MIKKNNLNLFSFNTSPKRKVRKIYTPGIGISWKTISKKWKFRFLIGKYVKLIKLGSPMHNGITEENDSTWRQTYSKNIKIITYINCYQNSLKSYMLQVLTENHIFNKKYLFTSTGFLFFFQCFCRLSKMDGDQKKKWKGRNKTNLEWCTST